MVDYEVQAVAYIYMERYY